MKKKYRADGGMLVTRDGRTMLEYMNTQEEFFANPTEKWSTQLDILNALPKELKDVVNKLKMFLGASACTGAQFTRKTLACIHLTGHGTTDRCMQDATTHLHVVCDAPESIKLVHDRFIRALKRAGYKVGLRVYTAQVQDLDCLMGYIKRRDDGYYFLGCSHSYLMKAYLDAVSTDACSLEYNEVEDVKSSAVSSNFGFEMAHSKEEVSGAGANPGGSGWNFEQSEQGNDQCDGFFGVSTGTKRKWGFEVQGGVTFSRSADTIIIDENGRTDELPGKSQRLEAALPFASPGSDYTDKSSAFAKAKDNAGDRHMQMLMKLVELSNCSTQEDLIRYVKDHKRDVNEMYGTDRPSVLGAFQMTYNRQNFDSMFKKAVAARDTQTESGTIMEYLRVWKEPAFTKAGLKVASAHESAMNWLLWCVDAELDPVVETAKVLCVLTKADSDRNSYILQGPSTCGKSYWLTEPWTLLPSSIVGRAGTSDQFAFETCANKLILCQDEMNIHKGTVDRYKSLLRGNLVQVDRKGKTPIDIVRTPLLGCCNRNPWHGLTGVDESAIRARMIRTVIPSDVVPALRARLEGAKHPNPKMWVHLADMFDVYIDNLMSYAQSDFDIFDDVRMDPPQDTEGMYYNEPIDVD